MGRVARGLEEAGISTIVHTWIPEVTASVGAPRIVGIGYPGSVPFGVPGDADGQRSVLRASLTAGAALAEPGSRADLDARWPAGRRAPHPASPPPIARAIMRRPWLYLDLLNGRPPAP